MLTRLGHLDPRKDGQCALLGGELEPRGLRVLVAIQPPEQPGPLRRGPCDGPGRVAPEGIRGRPGVGPGVPVRAAAVVGPTPGGPPRVVVRQAARRFEAAGARCPRPAGANLGHPGGGFRVAGAIGQRGRRPIAASESLEALLDAGERLHMASLPGERSGQTREVTRIDVPPPRSVRVRPIEVHQQATQGPDVLVVVADDIDQRARLAIGEEGEVPLGDLPAGDVAVPPDAKQGGLDGPEPCVHRAVTKEPADDRQEVEMAGMRRRRPASEPIPRDEQRPVEAATVVGHEPPVEPHVPGELGQERRLVGVIRQEQLDLAEPAALPPADPHEECQGAGRGGEARGFRVEAEQGSVRRGLARERGQPLAIDRQDGRRCLEADERPTLRDDELAIEGRGERLCTDPSRSQRGLRRRRRRRPDTQAGPVVREPPLERDGRGHAGVVSILLRP